VRELLFEESKGAQWWRVRGTSVREALAFSASYLEVIHDAFPRAITFPLLSQLSVFVISRDWPVKQFVKYAKYTTAAPMAKYLGNDLPVKPQEDLSIFPFSGGLRHFLRVQTVTRSKRALKFWQSVLQGVKRSCSPPDESFLASAYEDHREALSKPAPPFKGEISQYVHRIFDGKVLPRSKRIELSNSASLNNPRSQGGGAEEVIRQFHQVSFDEPLTPVLLRMVETSPGRVVEIQGRETPTFHELYQLVNSTLDRAFVKAVALLEPLKVRVITCGSAPMQSLLETLRKPIHSFLRKLAPCKLVGSPLCEEDLGGLVTRTEALGLDFGLWVSGDYKAATDNLNAYACKQVALALLDHTNHQELKDLVCESLFETTMIHPPPKLEGPLVTEALPGNKKSLSGQQLCQETRQRNGQLMGNPLSFPILTLVNLIGYWRTLESYLGKQVEVEDLPVLVNGDDILFRANPKFLQLWREQVDQLGLTLSVGKCYVHPRVLTLNSELWVSKRVGSGERSNCSTNLDSSTGRVNKCDVKFEKLEYYNPGLVRKGFASKTSSKLLSVSSVFTQALKGAQNPERALKRLLSTWKPEVAKATRNGLFNLFIPTTSGGLGVDPQGLSFRTTNFQRKLKYKLQLLEGLDPHELGARTCTITRKAPTSATVIKASRPSQVAFTSNRNEPRFRKPSSPDVSGNRRQDFELSKSWSETWERDRYRVPTGAFCRKLWNWNPTEVPAGQGIDPTGRWVIKYPERKYLVWTGTSCD